MRLCPPRSLVAACAASLLVLVACGDDSSTAEPAVTDETSEVGDSTVAASEATGQFPVSIEHMFGTTVVPAEPQRVVVAGLNETDYLLSLGIAPVGVHEWFGEFPYTVGPWAEPVRAELGAEPEVLDGFDVNVEWVASLDPDLIVVTYHDIDQTMYDQLSQIAPVVAHPVGPGVAVWAAPWRVQYRLIADAVGRREQAEEVIAGIDATIEQIKADHPLLAGATFNTGYLEDEGSIATYSSGDLANQMLAELGMHVPEELDAIADGVYIQIAAEQFELLDTLDTFIWLDDIGDMPAKAAEIPTFAATRLHTEGREVVPARDTVMAIAFNTPLSIPYYLDQLVPLLDAALDGDPATT